MRRRRHRPTVAAPASGYASRIAGGKSRRAHANLALHSARGAVRLIRGDSFKVLLKFAPNSFDAFISDPPHQVLRHRWDVLPTTRFWRSVFRVLKPGAPLIAIAAPQTYHRMAVAIEDAGFVVEDMGVWAFSTGRPPSTGRLKRAHAPIVIARKPGPFRPLNLEESRLPFIDDRDREDTRRADDLRLGAKRRAGVYSDSLGRSSSERKRFTPKSGRWPPNLFLTEPILGADDRFYAVPVVRDRRGHPAAKPVELLSHLLRAFTRPGDLVLDPFCGSASTGVACALTGRRAVLVEREADYVKLARKALARARRGDFGLPIRAQEALGKSAHSNDLAASCPPLSTYTKTSNNEHLGSVEAHGPKFSSSLVTPADMARDLATSTRTLRRLVADGLVSFVLVRGRPKFDRAAVRAALAGRPTSRPRRS